MPALASRGRARPPRSPATHRCPSVVVVGQHARPRPEPIALLAIGGATADRTRTIIELDDRVRVRLEVQRPGGLCLGQPFMANVTRFGPSSRYPTIATVARGPSTDRPEAQHPERVASPRGPKADATAAEPVKAAVLDPAAGPPRAVGAWSFARSAVMPPAVAVVTIGEEVVLPAVRFRSVSGKRRKGRRSEALEREPQAERQTEEDRNGRMPDARDVLRSGRDRCRREDQERQRADQPQYEGIGRGTRRERYRTWPSGAAHFQAGHDAGADQEGRVPGPRRRPGPPATNADASVPAAAPAWRSATTAMRHTTPTTMTAPSKIRRGQEPDRGGSALALDHRVERNRDADARQGRDEVETAPRSTWESAPTPRM